MVSAVQEVEMIANLQETVMKTFLNSHFSKKHFFDKGFNILGKFSFGIHCCPETRTIQIGQTTDCEWIGEKSGQNAGCKQTGKTAFGRCETSQTSSYVLLKYS